MDHKRQDKPSLQCFLYLIQKRKVRASVVICACGRSPIGERAQRMRPERYSKAPVSTPLWTMLELGSRKTSR